MTKPRLSLPQIFNMSFGFLGIQFGFGLQLANMSAIYAKFGAEPSKIPLLWLAGPMTGLLVQPGASAHLRNRPPSALRSTDHVEVGRRMGGFMVPEVVQGIRVGGGPE